MPLLLNPVHPIFHEACLRMKTGMICLSGGIGSHRHTGTVAIVEGFAELSESGVGCGLVADLRKREHLWQVEHLLESGVAVTSIVAESVIDCLDKMIRAGADASFWQAMPVDSIIAHQTLVPCLEGRKTLTLDQVASNNEASDEFKALKQRIEAVAGHEGTDAVRFADIINPDDEMDALIQGFLMGADIDESEKTWKKLQAENPVLARELRPFHLAIHEFIFVDETLLALLSREMWDEAKVYAQDCLLSRKKDEAIQRMLVGLLDPAELEFAFGPMH